MSSFATLAQLRSYLPQVSDLGAQAIVVSGATGGTFTLSYEGQTTTALDWDATATDVQTALRILSNIGTNGVIVTGRPGGPYTAKFQGSFVTDAGPLSGDAALLTGTTPAITVEPALDDLLQDCLDRASDTIRQALRAAMDDPAFDYSVYAGASTAIVRGYATNNLRLPAHNPNSVSLVELETGTGPLSYSTVDSTLYTEEGAYLYRPSGWGANTRYRVTAQWGYGSAIPQAIEEMTLELAVNIWRSRDKGGFTESVGVEGSGAVTVVSGLTKHQQSTIASVAAQLIAIGV